MKKHILSFVKFGVLFLIIALFIGKVYDVGVHRPPLKYANIPVLTQDYINEIGKGNNDMGVSYVEQGPFNWNNDDDFAYEKDGWAYEEDADFIVYYKRDKDAIWQTNAQEVLTNARTNIGLLEDLFGKYYYASDMNGRKLAIYLPDTPSLYKETICSLLGVSSYDTKSVEGLIVTEVGSLGCKTKGIVLSPACFDEEPASANGYITVLKHEMNHYVFFSSLDYSKDVKHYLWVSEGIAEYFCNQDTRSLTTDEVLFIDDRCHLNGEFPRERHAAYWAGESFFRFLAQKSGSKAVSEFILNAYSMQTDSIFAMQAVDVELLHKDWVLSLQESAVPTSNFSNDMR